MKLFWSKRAQYVFHEQVVWYEANRGHEFALTFAQNIENNVSVICSMPTIGRLIKEQDGRIYRSIANHPRCTIYYWHNKKEIHIANLRFAATR